MRTAALLLAALCGCTGSIGEDTDEGAGGGASEGQSMYAATVAPMMRSLCASCHEGGSVGPAFLGVAGGDDDYSALLANGRVVGDFSASSLLLTKGSHSGSSWWSSAQESTISAWFDAEAASHTAGGGTDIMAAWVGCMTLENWNDSKMYEWANKRTEDGATCGGCHADGEYNFFTNPSPQIMFAQQRMQTGIASFFQVSAAGPAPSVATTVDKLRNKCLGGNLHPSCAVDDIYVDYLKRFHTLTVTMQEAGLCGEPGYKSLLDPL